MSEKFVKMVLWNTKFRIIPTFRSLPLNQNRVAHIAVVCMAGVRQSASEAAAAFCCQCHFFPSQDQYFFGGSVFLFVSGSSILHLPHIFVTHTTLSRSRRRPGSLVWGKQLTAKTACPSTLHRYNSLSSSLTSSSHPTRCRDAGRVGIARHLNSGKLSLLCCTIP